MTRRDRELVSAVRIQRVARGFLTRRMLLDAFSEFKEISNEIEEDIQSVLKGYSSISKFDDYRVLKFFR